MSQTEGAGLSGAGCRRRLESKNRSIAVTAAIANNVFIAIGTGQEMGRPF